MEGPFTRPALDQGVAAEKNHAPKQQEGPQTNQAGTNDKQANRDFHRPPPPPPPQHQQQQQSHQFGYQI
jgi:hypothetical protein